MGISTKRVTLDIPRELHVAAFQEAVRRDISLTQLLMEVVIPALQRLRRVPPPDGYEGWPLGARCE